MQDPRDAKNNDGNEPSFSDPHDPRWSQAPLQPQPAPVPNQPGNQTFKQPANQPGPIVNPYQDQPLYAPPGTPQNPYPNQQTPHAPQAYPQSGPYAQQPMYRQPMDPAAEQGVSNVLGIISMVAGIIGLVTGGALLLPQLAAIVCGHLSLHREKPRRGFAIAGLITGYAGLAIGALAFIGMIAAFGSGAII